MTRRFSRSILGLLAIALLGGDAYAETFEFLSFTPPPGWMSQTLRDGLAYRRASGGGLITFYPSYPATGPASDEFVRMWRARVEPAVPGAAPQPQLQNQGDLTLAVGKRDIVARDMKTTVLLVAIVGRGRAIGVLATAAGDDVIREVTSFFASLNIAGAGAALSRSDPAEANEIEVDFEAPPGYVSRQEGRTVVLTPTTADNKTPCAYGVSPARASNGNLEADARAALLEALPGWQLKNDIYNAMRGTAAAGWPYYWFRTDVQRLVGGSYEYATAMAMAFPAGSGRVNMIWGAGNPARCTLDDLSFARLFHSLKPRGWASDGGKALMRDLQVTWRNSQRLGIAQYKFLANGRYEFGIGTVTRTGVLERTSSSASDGRYELRGGELIITPDAPGRGVSRYRVRIYEEFVLGRWTRAMSLLDESAKPALEVQYMRVDQTR